MTVPTVTVTDLPDPLPNGLTVLDVREPIEWQHGHITGSLHIPLRQVPERLSEVPTDERVLVVCKMGGRSAQAVDYLVHSGVDAVNLDGGLIEWHAAGRPMASEAAGPAQVV